MSCYSYFSSTPNIFNNSNIRYLPENGLFCLINSIFLKLIGSSKGSAIFCSLTNLIEIAILYCSFELNKANDYGGSIYLDTTNGKILFNSLCGFNCSSLNDQFFYIRTTNLYEISCNLTSVVNCNYLISLGYQITTFYGGNQKINLMNYSKNNLYNWAALQFAPTIQLLMKFCNFQKTYGYEWVGIWFRTGNNYINFCNFIENTQYINTFGLIYSGKQNEVGNPLTELKNSVFINNTNNLFQIQYGNIIVDSCYLPNTFLSSSITIINQLNLTNPFNFNYLSTFLCKNSFKILTSINKNLNNIQIFNFIILIFN